MDLNVTTTRLSPTRLFYRRVGAILLLATLLLVLNNHLNPWTRAVDAHAVRPPVQVRISAQVEEDQVECGGTPGRVVSYGSEEDGTIVVEC